MGNFRVSLVALATEIGDVLNPVGQGENIIAPEPAKKAFFNES